MKNVNAHFKERITQTINKYSEIFTWNDDTNIAEKY